jgi:1-acyl-sn-glycerol-3-phosphate acyltransferase
MSAMPTTEAADVPPSPGTATAVPRVAWTPPLVWRLLMVLARLFVPLVCRFRVTGEVPTRLRSSPLVLACNHIGIFDPISLTAACQLRRIAPRIMTTGGVFRAPLVGAVFRRCGHIRVERGHHTVSQALGQAIAAVRDGSVVASYPEGRITLDPGLWPERGKTGVARLALATGAVVVPVVQWGAHEVVAWDGYANMARTLLTSLWRRPLVRVHFGPPVDLSGLSLDMAGGAQRAADRITEATIEALRRLRSEEPGLPSYIDPTRPVSTARSYLRRRPRP